MASLTVVPVVVMHPGIVALQHWYLRRMFNRWHVTITHVGVTGGGHGPPLCKCGLTCGRPACLGPYEQYYSHCGLRCKRGYCNHDAITKFTQNTLQWHRGMSSHFVGLLRKANFKGRKGRAFLLIYDKPRNGAANWIGGGVDRVEVSRANPFAHALAREANEEYGRSAGFLAHQQHPTDAGAMVFRGSHMFVVNIPSGFSTRKGLTQYVPTQHPTETSGATWVWVDDVLKVNTARPHQGEKAVQITNVYGHAITLTTFVCGAASMLEQAGRL